MPGETGPQNPSLGLDFRVNMVCRAGTTCSPDPKKGCDFRNFVQKVQGLENYSQVYQAIMGSATSFNNPRPERMPKPQNYDNQSMVAACNKCTTVDPISGQSIPGAILVVDKVIAIKRVPEAEKKRSDRRDLYLPNSKRKFRYSE